MSLQALPGADIRRLEGRAAPHTGGLAVMKGIKTTKPRPARMRTGAVANLKNLY